MIDPDYMALVVAVTLGVGFIILLVLAIVCFWFSRRK